MFVNHTRELHGSEQVMIQTLRICKEQGWRVTMVMPGNRPDGGLAKTIEDEADILYLNYKNSGEGLLRTMAIELYNLPAVIRLCRWIRRNHIDCVYSNTTVTMLGVEAARWTHTPHVWHWHELPTEEFGWSKPTIRFLRYWASHSSQILFISLTQRRMWEEAMGINAIHSARVIYNPVQTIHPHQTDSPRYIRIGYMGSFMPRKNIHWLIQTAARLAKEYPLQLDLYGAKDQNEAKEIQSQWSDFHSLTVHEHTTDIESVYASLDIFVLPSWSETMPLVVLEAMQAGVAVIQTDQSGMTELMHDGEECLFVHPNNKESLFQALIRCMDPSFRTELAARGQIFATQWMAQNNYPNEIRSVFNNLLDD